MTSHVAPHPLPDIEVGMEWGPARVDVTEALNEQFLFAMQDYGGEYLPGHPPAPQAHPGTLLSLAMSGVVGFQPAEGWTGMHARDEVQLVRPVYVGETLILHWQVTNVYEKRGRPWWVRECTITDIDGRLRLRRRIHTAFQRDVSSGARAASQAAQPSATPVPDSGQAYQGAWKDITLPRLLTFSPHVVGSPGWPPVNHHTSRELAERAGLKAPIAAGTQTESYVLALLGHVLGASWWSGGALDLRFISPTYEGDRIRACAILTSSTAEPPHSEFEVWCEREDLSKVAAGTATCAKSASG